MIQQFSSTVLNHLGCQSFVEVRRPCILRSEQRAPSTVCTWSGNPNLNSKREDSLKSADTRSSAAVGRQQQPYYCLPFK